MNTPSDVVFANAAGADIGVGASMWALLGVDGLLCLVD